MLESFSFLSPYSVLFWLLITYHFLVANFEDSLSVSFDKFTMIKLNQTTVPEICQIKLQHSVLNRFFQRDVRK